MPTKYSAMSENSGGPTIITKTRAYYFLALFGIILFLFYSNVFSFEENSLLFGRSIFHQKLFHHRKDRAGFFIWNQTFKTARPQTIRLFVFKPCKQYDEDMILRFGRKQQVDREDVDGGFEPDFTVKGKPIGVQWSCPWGYYPSCGWQGFFIEFKLPSKASNALTASTTNNNDKSAATSLSSELWIQNTNSFQPLPPLLPSPPAEKEPLGVCVAPLFYFAHWPQLVQFLELWIQNGATVFWLYINTVAPETMDIIRMYQRHYQQHDSNNSNRSTSVKSVRFELVPWPTFSSSSSSSVPTKTTNDTTTSEQSAFSEEAATAAQTANANFYYAGQVEALNECLYRSRSRAEFVAFPDLDEIFLTEDRSESLIELLSRKTDETPNVGSFVFANHYATIGVGTAVNENENGTNHQNYSSSKLSRGDDPLKLSDVQFNNLHKIREDRINVKSRRGYQTRMIVKPERVKGIHVSQTLYLKPKTAVISLNHSTEAIVYHLRQFTTKSWSDSELTETDRLAEIAQNATNSFQQMITAAANEGGSITSSSYAESLPNRGKRVMAQMEACVNDLYDNQRREKCMSVWFCEKRLRNTTGDIDWVQLPWSNWIYI